MSSAPSINTRHAQNTQSSGVFIEPVSNGTSTVEVVCSSARHRMDHHAAHTVYRLVSHTLSLTGECVSAWPTTSSVCCWHCCHPFTTTPISIPRVISVSRTYEVYGVFCSVNCAKKFILERGGYEQTQVLLQLNELCVSVFGLLAADVYAAKPAPPRFFLMMFGGHLSIDEFRAHSLTCHTTLIMPPFVSHAMIMESRSVRKEDSATDAEVVEPLREGQHILRGLRRPTYATPAPPLASSSIPSRFTEFVRDRKDDADSSRTMRVAKKPRKKETRVATTPATNLNCFLTSHSTEGGE